MNKITTFAAAAVFSAGTLFAVAPTTASADTESPCNYALRTQANRVYNLEYRNEVLRDRVKVLRAALREARSN